jgi:2-polyprenyl-3-methyl-5-hydroxy-6-metoxy-1,4-benzoquinol methylase
MTSCPLCTGRAKLFKLIEGVEYFDCQGCDFIFAHPDFLAQNDRGGASREYAGDYWRQELKAARDRSWGGSLERFAEAALYCRIPIKRTIDIGTGPGYLLEALQHYLPSSANKFFGVEAFPPADNARRKLRNPSNYVHGFAGDLPGKFEMGTCIEVLEHLTPTMARSMAAQLREISVPGSLFIFNTSLAGNVRNGGADYLDPFRRGHIAAWSITSAEKVFGPHGFMVHELEGRDWAFVLEYDGIRGAVVDRIWTSPNKGMLEDPEVGSVMYLLGIEAARAYMFESRYNELRAGRK